MTLALILQGIPEAPSLNPIARWEWVFPVVESIHICGVALLVGTILVLDMRLLGVFFRQQRISELAEQLSPWIRRGLVIMLITGPYLLSSDAGEYVQIRAFRAKMVLFALALIFHFTVIRKATSPPGDSAPLWWRRPAAFVSLVSWLCVMMGGLWIGNL